MKPIIFINKATAEELQVIRGIGPIRSAKAIAARPYRDIYEFSNVCGLGPKRMKYILENYDLRHK